jgi:hypothetical protein
MLHICTTFLSSQSSNWTGSLKNLNFVLFLRDSNNSDCTHELVVMCYRVSATTYVCSCSQTKLSELGGTTKRKYVNQQEGRTTENSEETTEQDNERRCLEKKKLLSSERESCRSASVALYHADVPMAETVRKKIHSIFLFGSSERRYSC